jgi:uncharacterized membrane protein YfbV (UPF0208 family)
VPIKPTFIPFPNKIRSRIFAIVVFPLVPVIPIILNLLEGSLKNNVANIAVALRALKTTICGITISNSLSI